MVHCQNNGLKMKELKVPNQPQTTISNTSSTELYVTFICGYMYQGWDVRDHEGCNFTIKCMVFKDIIL